MKKILSRAAIANIGTRLSQFCAYTHLYHFILELFKGSELSEQTKAGRNIALLGFFCPFFWFALLSGAEASTVLFHAIHSSLVFLIGIVIMMISFKHNKPK